MTMNEFLQELEQFSKHFSPAAMDFYNELKEKAQNTFTENGKKILICMQKNQEAYKTFSSKQLGELLFMPPRSVSGAMKKLLNEWYCRKQATNPVTYELTTLGSETQLDD